MTSHPSSAFMPLGVPPVPKCAKGVTYGTSTDAAYLPGIAPGSAVTKKGSSALPLLAGAALLGTVLWLAIG